MAKAVTRSKNKKIAKISKKGVVSGVKKGTTKVYGQYKGKKLKVQKVATYYWNSGAGAAPGKIGIEKAGKAIGTWKAAGRDKNRWWDNNINAA